MGEYHQADRIDCKTSRKMEKMIVFYGNANGSLFPKELSVFQVDL
jgi:hypothetical protein